ncbi:MAG: phasin family protein [Rickettsiaceae bacterium]|nr:phasin family protein [Rickettsiaceae bacterium]
MNNFQNIFNADAFNFNETLQKNYETVVKANQVNVENAQAIFKRVGEIVQKQITEAVEATKDLLAAQNPEQTLNKQQHFIQHATKNAISDSKEVVEMVSKAGLEFYDIVSKRAGEQVHQAAKKTAKA